MSQKRIRSINDNISSLDIPHLNSGISIKRPRNYSYDDNIQVVFKASNEKLLTSELMDDSDNSNTKIVRYKKNQDSTDNELVNNSSDSELDSDLDNDIVDDSSDSELFDDSSDNELFDDSSDSEFYDSTDDELGNEFMIDKNDKKYLSKREIIKNIKRNYYESEISMNDIIELQLNDKDNLWFYKQFERIKKLDVPFDFEDKIKKRYDLLKTLKENNMYDIVNSKNERNLVDDVINSNHTNNTKTILLRKINSISQDSTEEYQKMVSWIDVILKIPTQIKSDNSNMEVILNKLSNDLNLNLSEMGNVVYEILQAVCSMLNDPERNGYILTLVGPPGVGKTSICSLIAKSIGMGFGHVSCGSISDSSILMGHSSTYVGSKPGVFTDILINSGQLDNVILLDEMDKLSDKKILPILLHVLDRTQNSRFHDLYCPEIDINLSKNFYVIAVNDVNQFDEALRDRLKIIELDGYNLKQKYNICKNNIIPKIIAKTGININFTDSAIKKYIKSISPNKSGVRELEINISDIYEKLLLIKNMSSCKYKINYDKLKYITTDVITKLTK